MSYEPKPFAVQMKLVDTARKIVVFNSSVGFDTLGDAREFVAALNKGSTDLTITLMSYGPVTVTENQWTVIPL